MNNLNDKIKIKVKDKGKIVNYYKSYLTNNFSIQDKVIQEAIYLFESYIIDDYLTMMFWDFICIFGGHDAAFYNGSDYFYTEFEIIKNTSI